jgi:hypothetical protein
MLKALRRLFPSVPRWFVDSDPLWGVCEAFGFGCCLAF